MLTHDMLAALEKRLRDQVVLSVSIDGTAHDPAAGEAWRTSLGNELAGVRESIEAGSDERDAFDQCVALLDRELQSIDGALHSPGWVSCVTVDGIEYAGALPIAVATRAAWGRGMRVTPLLRSLKHATPVVLELVDAKEVRLFRYWNDALERLQPVRVPDAAEEHERMGQPPRRGFHHGVHGGVGHDAAKRDADDMTQRMLSAAAERAVRFAGSGGPILVAGIPRVRALAAELVADLAPGHVLELEAVDIHATEPALIEAARTGASAVRNAIDGDRIGDLIEGVGSRSRATLGPVTTARALELGRVRELYLTQHYLGMHEAECEAAVSQAFAQRAHVEVVSGAGADRLDGYGGVGARLKFAQSEAAG